MGMYADFMRIVKTHPRGREDVCFSAKKMAKSLTSGVYGLYLCSVDKKQQTHFHQPKNTQTLWQEP
jgi:hypothetical protein